MKNFLAVLFLAAAVAMGLAVPNTLAQETEKKEAATAKPFRWDGRVVRINAGQSTLDARKGTITRTVHYDANTKWTKTQDKGIVDIDPKEVKEGDRVICLGKYNDKKEFWATRIDLRAPKAAY